MTLDARLLASALRAAADVLDSAPSAPAARAPRSTSSSRGEAREAFAARFGGKSCETCGVAIERGAMVFWGHERGQLRHASCAGASAPTTEQRAPSTQAASESAALPDDFVPDDFGAPAAGDDEIPF
jgi:hypothetical protein